MAASGPRLVQFWPEQFLQSINQSIKWGMVQRNNYNEHSRNMPTHQYKSTIKSMSIVLYKCICCSCLVGRGWTSWEQQWTEIVWPQTSGIQIQSQPWRYSEQLHWLLLLVREGGEGETGPRVQMHTVQLISQLLQNSACLWPERVLSNSSNYVSPPITRPYEQVNWQQTSLVRRALQYSSPEPAAMHPEHLG